MTILDTNIQPIRFIPVISSAKCPCCDGDLNITNVKVAIYNKNNIETGYANRNLLQCTSCELLFANQNMQEKMLNKILPNHFDFFFLTEPTSINDKDLILEKMFCKSNIPVHNPLKIPHIKNKTINKVKTTITKKDTGVKIKTPDFARDKNFNIIINRKGICIRHLPIVDSERCPCCKRPLESLISPIAIYNKYNQYIGNADYPLLRCTFCEISYANAEKLKLIGRQLGQYHAEVLMIQDLVNKDNGGMVAKDLVKGKMYSTKPIPIPDCFKKEYETIERERREKLKKEQDILYSENETAIAHQTDSDSDNDNKSIDFEGKINFINNEYIVWVYRSSVGCYNHIIKPVKAVVKDLDDNIVTIYVDYCSQCDKYYIDETSLSVYHKRFGIILLKIDLHESLWQGTNDFHRKSESILMYLGYTVRQGELSESQRHKLLGRTIDNGLIERGEIIKYLRMFIDTNGASYNNRYAKIRWQNDLNFIREHNANRIIQGKLMHV